MPPRKYKTEEEAKAAKLASNRKSARISYRRDNFATEKQKEFARVYPILKNGTAAAKAAGYSEATCPVIASENLRKPNVVALIEKEERNLKQAFKENGLDEEYLARNFKNVIDYNQQKVKKFYGEGENIREYEEMRDAKVVASTLVNVAKISGSSMELSNNVSVDVNADTAWLAIKSLIKKLSREQLGMVIESCEALLSSDCKVVS